MPGADREFEKDRKLFIGGLDYETTDTSLRDYFEQFGELTDWVVMKFPDTRRSRGFGFVTFKEPDNLEDCLSSGPHQLDGATVDIKRAAPREEERGGGGRSGGGRSGGRNDDYGEDPESVAMRKLFIGGINYSTTEDSLRDHFEQFGELKDCVIMKFSDSGRSRGFGFVTYALAAQLDECQANRPHCLDGKTLETKRATPRRESAKPEAQMTCKKLFVGGLSDDISDDDLRQYFSEFGHVTNTEQLKWNDTGKKRGFGFVEFDDYDPVDKIVLIGKHNLKNRKLEVKKALSKTEMSMMKRNDQVDVWGGGSRDRRDMRDNGRDIRDRRGGRGGRDRDDDRDDRRGGGGGMGGGMGGGFNNMMGNMGNMMNNMNMNMMRQMMMMSGAGGMGNMMGGNGGGMGNMGGMSNMMGMGGGFGNMMGNMGGMGGSFDDDDMPNNKQSKGYSTGSGGGSSMGGMGNMGMGMNNMGMMGMGMGDMSGGMGGMGGMRGNMGGRSGMGGGPMRGPGGNQGGRDNSAPYTRRSMDRGMGGRRF